MKLENIDGFSFDFPDALNAYKFDETDSTNPHFHGVPMKCVDIICLFNFNNVFNRRIKDDLMRQIPIGLASNRWVYKIAESCHVLNLAKWNQQFPAWPVVQAAGGTS